MIAAASSIGRPGTPQAGCRTAWANERPKITGPSEAAGDFVVQGEAEHGVPGLVNLYGIESPGLTSSLALADQVCALVMDPARGALAQEIAAS